MRGPLYLRRRRLMRSVDKLRELDAIANRIGSSPEAVMNSSLGMLPQTNMWMMYATVAELAEFFQPHHRQVKLSSQDAAPARRRRRRMPTHCCSVPAEDHNVQQRINLLTAVGLPPQLGLPSPRNIQLAAHVRESLRRDNRRRQG